MNELIERVWAKAADVGIESLTEREQIVHDVAWLEAEVNNGGFDQYFFNSAGDRATHAVEGLRRIGAVQAAEIAAEACRRFGTHGPSEDRYTRQNQLAALEDADFDQLDQRFFAHPDPIGELLLAYWRPRA